MPDGNHVKDRLSAMGDVVDMLMSLKVVSPEILRGSMAALRQDIRDIQKITAQSQNGER